MKILTLTLLSCVSVTCLYAQKMEISAQAITGLYHYSGTSATAVTSINSMGGAPPAYYTNDPYGNQNGFSYGVGGQVQSVSKMGFIVGLQAEYEILRSKVNINTVYPLVYLTDNIPNANNNYTNYPIPVKGQSYLQDQSINVSPYIGYRLKIKEVNVDLLPGIDVAFNVSSFDKGKATADDGTVYQTNFKLLNAPTDLRLKFGIAASCHKLGITAGYAHGLTNLDKNTMGNGNYYAHSEFVRFGLTYRIL